MTGTHGTPDTNPAYPYRPANAPTQGDRETAKREAIAKLEAIAEMYKAMQDECNAAQADLLVYRQLVGTRDREIEALRGELAAYKKAKSENDERFMIEREEARARVMELEAKLTSRYQYEDVERAEFVARAQRLAAALTQLKDYFDLGEVLFYRSGRFKFAVEIIDAALYPAAEALRKGTERYIAEMLTPPAPETSEPDDSRRLAFARIAGAAQRLLGHLDNESYDDDHEISVISDLRKALANDPAPSVPDAALRERCEALATEWDERKTRLWLSGDTLSAISVGVCADELRDALKGGEG